VRFVAIGRTRWLLDSIDRLRGAGHELVQLVTATAAPEYGVTEADFIAYGSAAGVETCVVDGSHSGALKATLEASAADVAVSINWPTIIPASTRGIFTHGILNVHAGDLPRFRGNAAPNWAILLGESQVVVTVHEMDDGLDSGPVLLKRPIPITEVTYIADVYDEMGAIIPDMLVDALNGIERGSLRAQPQPTDPSLTLRGLPRLPSDGAIDWALGASDIVRLVHASSTPFSGAFAYLDGVRVSIWRARHGDLAGPVVGIPGQVISRDTSTGNVTVLAIGGAIEIEVMSVDGGPHLPAANVISSTRARLQGTTLPRLVVQ
jgi:methionyl-tRNA formyltransferase